MLKKRNIAMVMAAATVATSVAPVFAAVENQNVDEATLIAKVEEMLNTKYSNSREDGDGNLSTQATGVNAYKNSVYQIKATAQTATAINEEVKSVSHLKELIEKVKVEKKVLTLAVVDKGHKIVDGSIEATEVNDRLTYAATADSTKGHVLLPTAGSIGTVGTVDAGQTKITLANGNEIEIAIGQYAFDLNKPVDANGNVIDANTTDAATQRRVVGFEMAVDTVNGQMERDLGSKAVVNLVFNNKDTKIEKELSDLITEDGYTEAGAEFVNTLLRAKVATSGAPLSVVKDGVRYNIGYATTTAVTAVKDGGYEFSVNLEAVKAGETLSGTATNVEITIKSDSQKDLVDLKTYIETKAAGTDDVVAGKITKLVGDTRFETAVEVSKRAYPATGVGTTGAGAVVLVGENAIVDGLAAAPLAAQEDAPILLTKKDTVPAETMNEIKRLVQKGSDIYLIGGENTISKEVEAELIKEMNANIIRVSGEDRYATSLAIAEQITTPNARAFVVGGEGLADAMSIAAIAANNVGANNVSPIIVTPKEGLTKDAKSYIKDTTAITSVDVIGGESNISTDVLKDIAAIKRNIGGTQTPFGAVNVERVAGADRNDTNAKVIKKYFHTESSTANTASLSNVYVAKNGNEQLIDALAAAPLAGKNQGAIVLATNDLTKAQNTAVKESITGTKTLTQVGGGIASTVISKLVELLGL